MGDEDLRQAIEALRAGRAFAARHREALRTVIDRQFDRDRQATGDDSADALQGYCEWLLADERRRQDLLEAPAGRLNGYLVRSFKRYLSERERDEHVGKLGRALDTAIRDDPRFVVRKHFIGLRGGDEAIWPESVWKEDSDRIEHAALADAAVAALTSVGCLMSRRATVVEILRHYVTLHVDLRRADPIDAIAEHTHPHDPEAHDERVHRVHDGRVIAQQVIERFTQEELDLLARQLAKDENRGRENQQIKSVSRKVQEVAHEFRVSPIAKIELTRELARQGQERDRPQRHSKERDDPTPTARPRRGDKPR